MRSQMEQVDDRKKPVIDRQQVYVIGLTGNIATGKSSVGNILVSLGAQHIDADTLAHQAMAQGEPAWHDIVAHFGRDILGTDGEIDRKKLGAIVFADAGALRQLEAIVHPDVIARTKKLISTATAGVVVVEAIKLVESGMVAELCDALWVVTAPREVQIQRLVEYRGLTRADAILRIDAQPPQEDKVKRADVVIKNDRGQRALACQVRDAWLIIQNPILAIQ
ncbi:MAG: dephospho-CoA kinase [Anaerolineae bacterium]|nr:dephospho-CoA kinase [Anaerolineae bacterium]